MNKNTEKINSSELTTLIRIKMKKLGYTQNYLSDKTNVSQSHLSEFLNGKSFVSYAKFKKICTALNLTKSEFTKAEELFLHIQDIEDRRIKLSTNDKPSLSESAIDKESKAIRQLINSLPPEKKALADKIQEDKLSELKEKLKTLHSL